MASTWVGNWRRSCEDAASQKSCGAVDAGGEVLDVLVQSKRNEHTVLKVMRKLLKKYAFTPQQFVTDDV
jgi:transposase-like protein